ncbi:MAG: aspartate aminotransferase family protein [Solirubrobacteraceae bacterium]
MRPYLRREPLSDLQLAAIRHLWPHFSPVGAPGRVFVRGEGCHVWDEEGNRFLDGLSMLFCVNAGHGRRELAEAAAEQAGRLAYATTWGPAHPPAIALAQRIAALAPGDLDRVFFTSGGGESVDSALKLARAFHRLKGEAGRFKVIARDLAYHGTTTGALAATGLTYVRTPFEPLPPGGCHAPSTYAYRAPAGRDPLWAADAVEERILFEGPETVAAVIVEPVQNSGGCITPPDGYFARLREICDRHGVLLISDDTICAWGRLGTWFGAQRYDYLPDMITTAKGITSAYAPMGAVIASLRIAEPFVARQATFDHGLTFGGHPVAAAVALANIDVIEREDLLGNVRRNEPLFEELLRRLLDLRIVGDVRGAGYFWAIELVKDAATREPFDADEAERLMAGVGRALEERGLIARALTRGYPVVQLAPPLIAGPDEIEEMVGIVRDVLTVASDA